jgi:predicted alpha/beta-hydrolase family hydrolase
MKRQTIQLKAGERISSAVLLTPPSPQEVSVILAHGAGGNMHSDFLSFFQERIAAAGYRCIKFNFFYTEAGRKAPDPQPLLLACYEKAMEATPGDRMVIGGKSMGGRMASYIADRKRVAALLFLGYPLHPPGKTEQLRDEHLYSVRKPMFFASGTKDPFARLDLLHKTIKKIGRFATAHYVEGGGHSFEVPKKIGDPTQIREEVAMAVVRWLQGLPK